MRKAKPGKVVTPAPRCSRLKRGAWVRRRCRKAVRAGTQRGGSVAQASSKGDTALVVFKLPGNREKLAAVAPALRGGLLEIEGVLDVLIDACRETMQILYKRGNGTVDRVQVFLNATGWSGITLRR